MADDKTVDPGTETPVTDPTSDPSVAEDSTNSAGAPDETATQTSAPEVVATAAPDPSVGSPATPPVIDKVAVNNYLSNVLNDVEALIARVDTVLAQVEVSSLREHLVAARDWAAQEIGLERTANDAGWQLPGSGNANMPAAQNGQTDAQK